MANPPNSDSSKIKPQSISHQAPEGPKTIQIKASPISSSPPKLVDTAENIKKLKEQALKSMTNLEKLTEALSTPTSAKEPQGITAERRAVAKTEELLKPEIVEGREGLLKIGEHFYKITFWRGTAKEKALTPGTEAWKIAALKIMNLVQTITDENNELIFSTPLTKPIEFDLHKGTVAYTEPEENILISSTAKKEIEKTGEEIENIIALQCSFPNPTGTTCYMNAALKAFFRNPYYRKLLISDHHQLNKKTEETAGKYEERQVLFEAMRKLYQEMQQPSSPSKIQTQLKAILEQMNLCTKSIEKQQGRFEIKEYQDASEFLEYLLEALEADKQVKPMLMSAQGKEPQHSTFFPIIALQPEDSLQNAVDNLKYEQPLPDSIFINLENIGTREIPNQLTLKQQKMDLHSITLYTETPKHYVTLIKRADGTWQLHNDTTITQTKAPMTYKNVIQHFDLTNFDPRLVNYSVPTANTEITAAVPPPGPGTEKSPPLPPTPLLSKAKESPKSKVNESSSEKATISNKPDTDIADTDAALLQEIKQQSSIAIKQARIATLAKSTALKTIVKKTAENAAQAAIQAANKAILAANKAQNWAQAIEKGKPQAKQAKKIAQKAKTAAKQAKAAAKRAKKDKWRI